MGKLLHEDEAYAIRGACYEVYKTLGCGFLEALISVPGCQLPVPSSRLPVASCQCPAALTGPGAYPPVPSCQLPVNEVDMSDYKDLQVWQRSIDFVVEIYTLVKTFPAEEKYALGDQMRRAAVSIPSNIAEGMERCAVKEKLHFLSIAIGSLAEIETQLVICGKLSFVTNEKSVQCLEEVVTIRKMLYRLSAALKQTLNN